MKTLKAASQYAIIFLFALLASSCIDEEPEDETTSFIHNSPRPDCLYHIDPNRKAWYETPVVVSPGWGTPVKLAEPLTDHCPNDAVEISRDGKTLYFYWSPIVNAPYDVLLHIHAPIMPNGQATTPASSPSQDSSICKKERREVRWTVR